MTQMDLFPEPTPRKPSSPPVIPANRSATPVSASDRRMTATSGRTCFKLLHKNDRLGAVSKMFMVTSQWASTKCFLTWKVKGTPAGRLLFQLAPLMRPIEETGCGLLPTARATDGTKGSRTKEGAMKEMLRGKNKDLGMVAALSGEPKMWPTPDTRGFTNKGSLEMLSKKSATKEEFYGMAYRTGKAMKDKMWPTYKCNLDEAVRENHHSGQLSADWVEWLMGYPAGWTSLETTQEQSKASKDEPPDLEG